MICRLIGDIPEKEFVSIRNSEGKMISSPANIHQWEYEIRQRFLRKLHGWTVEDINGDMDYGAYIPLKVVVDIHRPTNKDLVKQHKALGDALAGALYVNDCVITDLDVRFVPDSDVYASISAEESTWDKVVLPREKPMIIRQFSRITDTGYDEKGFSLDLKAAEKDKEFRDYIQSEFLLSGIKLAPGEKELIALMQCRDINTWTPMPEKKAMLMHQKMPTTTPDCDNIAYSLVQNLIGLAWNTPTEITRIHIVKDWRPDKNNPRHKIWIRNKQKGN